MDCVGTDFCCTDSVVEGTKPCVFCLKIWFKIRRKNHSINTYLLKRLIGTRVACGIISASNSDKWDPDRKLTLSVNFKNLKLQHKSSQILTHCIVSSSVVRSLEGYWIIWCIRIGGTYLCCSTCSGQYTTSSSTRFHVCKGFVQILSLRRSQICVSILSFIWIWGENLM